MFYFVEFKTNKIFVRETDQRLEPYLTKEGSRHWVSAANKDLAVSLAGVEAEGLQARAEGLEA
jgi:hypothetical protein